MTAKEYKYLTMNEFTKAAEVYESDNAGVYNMCKKTIPRCLRNLKRSLSTIFWTAAAEQVPC